MFTLSWCDDINLMARKSMKYLLIKFIVYLMLTTILDTFLSSSTHNHQIYNVFLIIPCIC